MNDILAVILDDAVAGTITRLPDDRLRFDYDEAYRGRADPTPLSISMPTTTRSHSHAAISPWLWGLLPDRQTVLERWAREFHVSSRSPFALLSTPIGHDCAGAARFASPDDLDEVLYRPGSVTWLTESDVAGRLRALREDSTAWLGRDFSGQFSLAGAQAKTALLNDGERWGVPSGAAATSHILKPAVTGLDDHDLNEHLCLDAARRAGLTVARSFVGSFEEESAIVVERYDRRTLDGCLMRIHQEDLCQALAVPPMSKYQNEGGPGPSDVRRLLQSAMAPRVADEALWGFFEALAWNWLIAGTDAHAKNYSLMLVGGQVRLAPFYDIASALPYGAHERKLRFAMKLGGDYRVYPHSNPWPSAARELGLDGERALERVRRLAGLAAEAFSASASEPGVAGLSRALPARLVDLVAERAKRCLAVVDQPPLASSAKPRALG